MSRLVKNILSGNVEESFKRFLDYDPEVDDFRNVISSVLSTDRFMGKLTQRSDK